MERSGGLDGGGKTESLLQPFNYGPIELLDFLQPLSYILLNIDQPGNSFYLFSSHLI
jgi:hypothetical protein